MTQLNTVYKRNTTDSDMQSREKMKEDTSCKQKPKESWSAYANTRQNTHLKTKIVSATNTGIF